MEKYLTQQNIIYCLYVLLFILLFATCHALFTYLKNNNVISNSLRNFYEKTEADVEERLRLEQMQKAERGNVDKENILLKLDKTINYSNIKKYIPFLNSNIYIFTMVLFASIGLIIGSELVDFILGLALAGIIVLLYIIILLLMANRSYKKVEENVVTFMNLVENYAKTNNDLISIMGKIYYYLDDPLKTHVQECYLLGLRTGDSDMALEKLQNSVQHKKFQEIIRNLIICSHYEANYEEVIEDSRAMLMEYLAGKRERAAMARNARIELVMLVGICALVVYMMGDFLGDNIINILMETFLGKLILAYLMIVLGIVIFQIIFIGRNKD